MRKYYIDNLRSSIVLLVIFYHIIYIFNNVGVITNVVIQGIPQMDIFLYLIYPWFMVCLFLLAGMSAKYALSNKSKKQFLKERTKKLLIPSIAGIFILGWISGYITNQYTDMFSGNGDIIPAPIKYLIYCISGIGPLWFAHELFLASIVLCLILKADKNNKIYNLCKKTTFPVILLIIFPFWGSSFLLNTPVIEVYRNGIYIFSFLLGYYIFSHEHITGLLKKYCFILLAASVITGIIYTAFFWGENYASMKNLQHPLTNAYAYFMSLTVIGLGKKFMNRETSFTRYMRKRSFGFYILHYPILISITYLLDSNFHVPALAFYFILIILEAVFLPLFYEIVIRIPVLRTLLLGGI